MGVTDSYFGYLPISKRHNGDGLPMTFYDGHGAFELRGNIYPFVYTSWPYTMIEWSLRTKFHAPRMDK